ncbi:MAG TPA: branched-chain amino acid ABC transporter substrate-binding protein, partial [Methylomirabilota bacterium]|nr:branched-chain amino acid ABC transporter substrate-binding protein [Methylomirabilota bacterium]
MTRHLIGAVLALLLSLAPVRADVVIGVAGPLSGAFAPVGDEIVAGVTVAVDRLNAAGGIAGERVVVETADDKCDATTGAAVANQLVGRGAALVVGHACTAAALPAASVYAGNGIVFISPAATNPRLTDEGVGPGVFRLAPRSDGQPRAIGDYLAEVFAGDRIAFVHDGGVYGQGLAEGARAVFEATGTRAVVTQSYTPGEDSQNALIGVLQDAVVDVVVIGGLHADAAVIASQMRSRGLGALIVGGEALGLEEFRDLAGPAAEGVVFALPIDLARLPEAQTAVADFRALGIEPTGATLPAFAAVELYATAVEEAGDDAFSAVIAELAGGAFETVIGSVSFDGKGDRSGSGWALNVWRDGAPVP